MVQLENFIERQIKTLKETEMLIYIEKFKTLSESSQPMNIRKSSFLGYISIINVIRRNSVDETRYPQLIDKIMKNILIILKDNDPRIVSAGAECLYNIPYLFSKRNCLERVFQIFFEKFFARFKQSFLRL